MYKALTKSNKKLQESRIEQSLWTKGDILAFGKMLNSMRFSDKERKDEVWELYVKLEDKCSDNGYNITQEQSEFGIEWLKSKVLTKKGKLSTAKCVDSFCELEANIIRNFHSFEFMGFWENCNGYTSHYTPVYRCIDVNGNYFDYYAIYWGNMEVVGRGKYKSKLEKILA